MTVCGLCAIRKKELDLCVSRLNKNISVTCRDHIQDSSKDLCLPEAQISKCISSDHLDDKINVILTFDKYGVSGHLNHRAVYSGVRCLLASKPGIQGYVLTSFSLARNEVHFVCGSCSYLDGCTSV